MVLNYICTNKCFFKDRICNPGDVVTMDSREGDAHPWFKRDQKVAPAQAEMQKGDDVPIVKENKTKAPAPNAGAKVVSKNNGDKTE